MTVTKDNVPVPEQFAQYAQETRFIDAIEKTEDFVKNDENKPRVDLLPPSSIKFAEDDLLRLYLEANRIRTKDSLQNLGEQLLNDTTLLQVSVVLGHGAKKYPDNNWMKCKELHRYWGSLGRHILAMVVEGYGSPDKDSGLKHSAHAMCNVLILMEMI